MGGKPAKRKAEEKLPQASWAPRGPNWRFFGSIVCPWECLLANLAGALTHLESILDPPDLHCAHFWVLWEPFGDPFLPTLLASTVHPVSFFDLMISIQCLMKFCDHFCLISHRATREALRITCNCSYHSSSNHGNPPTSSERRTRRDNPAVSITSLKPQAPSFKY